MSGEVKATGAIVEFGLDERRLVSSQGCGQSTIPDFSRLLQYNLISVIVEAFVLPSNAARFTNSTVE